jgi:FlaA1/EpsC-like NDP-sugar epimerase
MQTNPTHEGPWFIFGAGTGGTDLLNHLPPDFPITAFLDNNPTIHGTSIRGIPVSHPSSLLAIARPHVLIASMYSSAIAAQLNEMGIDPSCVHSIDVNPTQNRIAKQLNAIGIATRELPGFPKTFKMQYQPIPQFDA